MPYSIAVYVFILVDIIIDVGQLGTQFILEFFYKTVLQCQTYH